MYFQKQISCTAKTHTQRPALPRGLPLQDARTMWLARSLAALLSVARSLSVLDELGTLGLRQGLEVHCVPCTRRQSCKWRLLHPDGALRCNDERRSTVTQAASSDVVGREHERRSTLPCCLPQGVMLNLAMQACAWHVRRLRMLMLYTQRR